MNPRDHLLMVFFCFSFMMRSEVMQVEIVQSKIVDQVNQGNTIRTQLHLLLEIQPKRFLIKAKLEVSAIDGVLESISYEVDPAIFKELMFSRGVDYTGEARKSLDDFIMDYLKRMVEE